MPALDEASARAAHDAVTAAHVALQREAHVALPDARAAARFADATVERVDAEAREPAHREPLPPAPGLPPDHLSRGEVGADTVAVHRAVGAGEAPVHQVPTVEDPRLLSRLELLDRLDDWRARLTAAMLEGERFAQAALGYRPFANPVEMVRFMAIVADHVMNVVEQSNATFGDWRAPPRRAPLILVG